MGMGSASFWVQSVLLDRSKLPTQKDFIENDEIRLRLGPLVWNTEKQAFINRRRTKTFFDVHRNPQCSTKTDESEDCNSFSALISKEFNQELERHELKFENNFSYDVVLSLEDLAKGLGIDYTQSRDMLQAMVEEKLGIYTKNDWQKPIFEDWIIFNARQQKFQIVYGMQAEKLRMLIGGARSIQNVTDPAQRDARAHIINAFSMMNADGSEPRSVDFHSFRGAFTPEFYPRRFALKDSIYSQRLDILAFLLQHALYRFSTSVPPITYCEFSIGNGDISRPWIFDILSAFSKYADSSSFKNLVDENHFPWLKAYHPIKEVDYRFLAGFDRRIPPISNAYSTGEAVTFLHEVPHYAIHLMLREFYKSNKKGSTIMFTEQVKQLRKMKEESENNPHFSHLVVGIDLFGDELGYPYCPFVAYDFVRFVEDARCKNPKFGVRIHCAENVPFIRPELPGYRLFAAHMYIVYRCLSFLKQKLKSNIRIGHGIAFDKLLCIKNYKFRKSSVLVAEIQRNAKRVLSSIPFEINLTSNFYLLGDAIRNVGMEKPLSALYSIGTPVILSTDDDGIWPIDKCPIGHQSHHSLAAEYCRAISSRFITKVEQLEKMIAQSEQFRFHSRKSLEDEATPKATSDDGSNSEDYFPTDIIVHPDVLRVLLKIELESKNTCKCWKYYQKAYGQRTYNEDKDTHSGPSEDLCKRILPMAVAYFYVTRSLPYEEFKIEYLKLFKAPSEERSCDEPNVDTEPREIFDACENVYSQLMCDTPSCAVYMQVSVGEEQFLFCSEAPDNRGRLSALLRGSIERFITSTTTKGTIQVFFPSVDFDRPEIESDFKTFEEHMKRNKGDIKIYVYTNSEKESRFQKHNRSERLFINDKPKRRTGPTQEGVECGFYAVCPHGSVATSALNFIAQRVGQNNLQVKKKDASLSTLVVPFLPVCFDFPPNTEEETNEQQRERFLGHYSISDTELAKKIELTKNSLCRNSFELEYYSLCSDIKYTEPIHTRDLIETICEPVTEFLKILKTCCECMERFNLLPESFVVLNSVREYESYKRISKPEKIPIPILELGERFLICSRAEFFAKESPTAANRLWSLAVGDGSPMCNEKNPYEYPFNKWVRSILRIPIKTLNEHLGIETWEQFVMYALCSADRQIWRWYTVSRWCDLVTDIFSVDESLTCFKQFLLDKPHEAKLFEQLLTNSARYKLGIHWQREVIEKHPANSYLESILERIRRRQPPSQGGKSADVPLVKTNATNN